MWTEIKAAELNLKFFLTYRFTREKGHSSGVRWLPFSLFEYSPQGSWRVSYGDGHEYVTQPGEVFFVPAGSRHTLEWAGGADSVETMWAIMRIERTPGRDMLEDAVGGPGMPAQASDRIREIIAGNLAERHSPDCMHAIENHLAAFEVLRLILPLCEYSRRDDMAKKGRLDHVLEFIEQNYREDLSREQLASLANLSPPRFHALFKSLTGNSPWQFVLERRLRAAQSLLLSTDLSMEEIALKCGFKTGFYFSRLFRKHVGVSPSSFRKNMAP